MHIAYIAGIIDGEGTITLTRIRKSDMFRSPVVSVSSTTPEILDLLKAKYGGYISTQKVYKAHHKQSYSWKLVNDKAFIILDDIKDYIVVPEKKYRCDLLLESYKQVTPRNGRYTSELLRLKQEFEEKFFNPA